MVLFTEKKLVGAVERIHVIETGMAFRARIDTGARTTSLHAVNIWVENGEQDKNKNIGKYVSFNTLNELGQRYELRLKIVNLAKISNAQGIESRYMVKLNLLWENCQKQIEVNLRDRSHMKYKLLMGRDWLKGDFLVNVEIGDE